jgi:hypothetical protein
MKARELMVGDLFRINKSGLCIVKDAIIKVTGINSENEATHCVDINDEDNNGGIWCEYLEPIALTYEILEKNGFLRSQDGKRFIGNGMTLSILSPKSFCWFSTQIFNDGIVPFKYVHELQHALRLCGIDKNIEL